MRSKVKTDGTDPSATVQAEINALMTAGGGTLYLPVGTIRLNSQIVLPNDTHTPGAA